MNEGDRLEARSRATEAIAMVAAGATVVMIIGSAAALVTAGPPVTPLSGPVALHLLAVLAYLPWVGAGLLLVLRLPSHPVGWTLLVVAVSMGNLAGLEVLFTHLVQAQPSPTTEVVAVVGDAVLLPSAIVAFIALLLLYPDGKLPSDRWRGVLWISGAIGMAYLTVTLFARAPLYYLPATDNPLGWFGGPRLFELVQTASVVVLVMGGVSAGIGVLAVRWRTAGALERRQIKWLLWAATLWLPVAVALLVYGIAGGDERWDGALDVVGAGVPVAVVIAVTRYRLFEIDRMVSRTVTYAAVAAVLAGVYTAGVVGVQAVLPVAGDVAVAGSTLAVVALFNPVRRRVQVWVERRFNRARYDATRVVDDLSLRLRDEVDLDVLTADWVGVVHRTMQPAAVGVWMREAP